MGAGRVFSMPVVQACASRFRLSVDSQADGLLASYNCLFLLPIKAFIVAVLIAPPYVEPRMVSI